MFKEWLEKFARDNNIELAKIYDGLNIYDKAMQEAKAKAQSENESLKAQNLALKNSIESLRELGIKGENLKAEISALLSEKGKSGEAMLDGLKAEISALKSEIETEKKAKIEAVRKNKLKSIIEAIPNLNKDHAEIVEIKLNNALKLDDSGKEYFEKDGSAVDTKSFLDEFFKANQNYIKPQGSAGNGVKDDLSKGRAEKSFKDMTLTEKAILFKTNPSEYERLKNLGE
ncbi:hypothetical protein OFO10_05995 [Campylobacter sp. VBCF_06 NA8]|uniref:hypothetical protein n=1 Tax=Campylobacter sp. VBCF_06 NA8 TaxID=2983822 RepID=UPI0022E9D6B9|nr:hypothetical protein [Campylobacter sp. VBCF_06 NA8]MDA3046706.1 hypothetical protein [Campylobacter sp. VBCF_06 NA8]